MMDHYILEGHETKAVGLTEWAAWFKSNNSHRHVADNNFGSTRISTVFLGLDHAFDGGAPMLFETMVFGGRLDGECVRCSTWDQAEKQHLDMMNSVREADGSTAPPTE